MDPPCAIFSLFVFPGAATAGQFYARQIFPPRLSANFAFAGIFRTSHLTKLFG
jgi:hypothetical protein